MPKPHSPSRSDRCGQLVERDRQAPVHRRVEREFVVAAADVLDQRVGPAQTRATKKNRAASVNDQPDPRRIVSAVIRTAPNGVNHQPDRW
jgi:hypothetical protein